MKRLWLIGLLLVALTGCRHKTLWMGGTEFATIEVIFDWEGEDDHDHTRADEDLSMSMYLYPVDGGAPLYYELAGHEGGQIRVPFGKYDVVAWNHENDAVQFRGTESAATLEAYTREQPLLGSLGLNSTRAPRPESVEEERSVLEPGVFWTGTRSGLEVSMDTSLEWTIPMEESFLYFSVIVKNVKNIEFVSEVSFALTSVCATYFPFTHTLGEESVTIPFGGNLVEGEDGEEYMLAYCTLFGHCPKEEHPHWLTVYAVLDDGSKYFSNVDVSPQVHNPDPVPVPGPGEDPGISPSQQPEISIDIEDISFPNPYEGDPLAFAKLDDWITERIDLIMH